MRVFCVKSVAINTASIIGHVLFAAAFFIIVIFGTSVDAQVAAIAAIDEPEPTVKAAIGRAAGSTGASSGVGTQNQTTNTGRRGTTRNNTRNTAVAKSKPTPAPKRPVEPAKYNGFVIGDKYSFLNFEVVSAEKPYHTRAAKAEGADGLVQVEVLIDEDGSVLTAKARTGNKLLHPEAERAALASKFNRPIVYGKPARAMGFLVYRFGNEESSR